MVARAQSQLTVNSFRSRTPETAGETEKNKKTVTSSHVRQKQNAAYERVNRLA